jgi:IPT/TIG domain-containing protein/polymorphic membrane protein
VRSKTGLLLILLVGVSIAPPVFAATTTVTTTNDSGAGSLRDAIQTASPGDTIQFNLPNPSTINLTGGSLNIDKDLTIIGPGAASLTIHAGNNAQQQRAFTIGAVTVSITNLTITGGRGRGTAFNATDSTGGAIYNLGTLSLNGVVVSNSSAPSIGLGGGGIFNDSNATLTLTNCTVTGNSTGANQLQTPPTRGGGIRSVGGSTLTLTNTTVSNNFAQEGGGVWSNGTLTISASTFFGNSGGNGVSIPPGGSLDGGAIYVNGPSTAVIVNSTFSGNTAKSGGAAVASAGTTDISNSTFSDNSTDLGGGTLSALGHTLRLKGNILSNFLNCDASGGTISSSGYNVSTDATCSLNGQDDISSVAAGLDPAGLQDNGGPTKTIALLSSSTAKDRIPASCTALDNTTLATDQRGTTRPQGTNCDGGSFELNQASSFTVTNTNDSGAGSLRQAILDANAATTGVTINFDLTTYPATIMLTSGTLNIAQNVAIHGPGASDLTIDGNHNRQILSIASGKNVSVSGLTFANGNNDNGGAVFNSGNLTVAESVFTGNTSAQGGAIDNFFGATLTVTDSTFSGNSASVLGGGIFNFATATVTRSTFSNNTLSSEAAGVYNQGTMTIVNSTFAGNQANNGGGALENNGSTSTLHLSNSTFFDNSGGPGFGAFYNIDGATTIKGTLLARGPSNANNCAINTGTVSSGGYNLSDDTSCGALGAGGLNDPTDKNNTPAGLDSAGLQDNGGPTQTIALLPTSEAINAIPSPCTDVDGVALSTDQRGIVRPVGGGCEIGAFELNQAAPVISNFTPTAGPVGTSVIITGTSFTGVSNVTFNGTSATFTFDSDTQITATVPNGATTGAITVTAPGGTATSSSNFTVAPTISGFTPTNGPVGTAVTITGTNFTGATAVTFNGTGATFTVDTPTQITATVPIGATSGSIAVTTAAGTGTSVGSFTVTVGPAPTITSFSPDNGIAGTSVTINGANFSGATSVSFGSASTNQLTVANNGKKITVNVPAGASTGPITVTTPGGTATSATNFTIVSPPTIINFNPSMGSAGTPVAISGTNFIGVTSVMFDGKNAKFTVLNSGQISATVPSGIKIPPGLAAEVLITVTNPAGMATSAGAFTVTK